MQVYYNKYNAHFGKIEIDERDIGKTKAEEAIKPAPESILPANNPAPA